MKFTRFIGLKKHPSQAIKDSAPIHAVDAVLHISAVYIRLLIYSRRSHEKRPFMGPECK